MTGREVLIDEGWDSRAYVVDGVWLDREPRRPEVERALLAETTLMPWLAEQLPLPVPVPRVVRPAPLRVRHRMLTGRPVTGMTVEQGAAMGRFLAALHGVSVEGATARGVPSYDVGRPEHRRTLGRLANAVLPRLHAPLRPAGQALLDRLAVDVDRPVLLHGDLGPAHVLHEGDAITGVIDWSDARIGDAALDLAWLGHGSGAGEAVVEAYAAGPEVVRRARDWHLLGPWHEVCYGLDEARPELVDSGMDGVVSRLRES